MVKEISGTPFFLSEGETKDIHILLTSRIEGQPERKATTTKTPST